MNNFLVHLSRISLPIVVFGLSSLSQVSAFDLDGVAIHGSISGTAAYSDRYNYYGETDGKFDIIQKEITLNGGYRFENGLRIGAQAYAFDLDGYSKLTLDFANLDYSFNQAIGLRVGRNKLPYGLYSEVQDLDQVRIFASLPLPFYPRGLRSLRALYDGGDLYGNIAMGKGGSLDYQLYGGTMPKMDGSEPFIKGLANLSTVDGITPGKTYGGSLVWNTPVDGLKLGYTYQKQPKLKMMGTLATHAVLVPRGYAGVAEMIDAGYGKGTWDNSGLFAGTHSMLELDVVQSAFSAEYTRGDWIATIEYGPTVTKGINTIAALGLNRVPFSSYDNRYYAQVAWQVNKRFGAGVYYAFDDSDPKDENPAPKKFTTLQDIAVGASFALKPWWLLKAEVHVLDGLGGLGVAGDLNPGAINPKWNYLVLKSTISF